MPLEVVELVLSHVPLTCLLSTCCLVSRAWRDIISNPLYLPWAKRYLAYKVRRQGAECAGVPPAFIVQAYLDHFFEEVGAAEEDVLPGLISHTQPPVPARKEGKRIVDISERKL